LVDPCGSWLGLGKTRTGSEWIRKRVDSGEARQIALVAPRAADVRDIMVEGISGILNVFPTHQRPLYEPSKRRITFHTGAMAITYSGDEPDQLRGPNIDTAWVDELASASKQKEIMDMVSFCLRVGKNPRCMITTTPRPTKTIKELVIANNVHITRGSTFENRENLSPVFFDAIIDRLENTRLGRQEIYAEILDDNPKALWKSKNIEETRVNKHPTLVRVVVGVDPAITANKNSDETGIIAVGKGNDGHFYILDDKSCIESPNGWGNAVVSLYNKLKADRIVAEINQGGDMVEHVIKTIDQNVSYKGIHASRGKKIRAEPIAALFEQGKCHMVGTYPDLETQMIEWDAENDPDSPDRIDALTIAITELMGGLKKIASYNPAGIEDFTRESPHKF
jgi:predicted phage terminase large subunit-like protein